MVRTTDYESRRKAILAATINRYIKDAVPVASDDIAGDFEVSPATIRNVFAELEEEGYLTHPYTSGGRVPTNKGYRYYVDFLILQMELLQDDKERVVREYRRQANRLEDLLDKTSEVLSAITHYTSIVYLLDWQERFFYNGLSFIVEQPEFQDLRRLQDLLKAIEGKQRLLDVINRQFQEKVKIYIGDELGCEEMKGCSLVVSTCLVKNKPLGRLAVLGPVRMEYKYIIPALGFVSDILADTLDRV